jgi:hypothetical protein
LHAREARQTPRRHQFRRRWGWRRKLAGRQAQEVPERIRRALPEAAIRRQAAFPRRSLLIRAELRGFEQLLFLTIPFLLIREGIAGALRLDGSGLPIGIRLDLGRAFGAGGRSLRLEQSPDRAEARLQQVRPEDLSEEPAGTARLGRETGWTFAPSTRPWTARAPSCWQPRHPHQTPRGRLARAQSRPQSRRAARDAEKRSRPPLRRRGHSSS